MRHFLRAPFICLVAIAWAAPAAHAERFAVLVGINAYSHPSLPALKYAVLDVKDLAVVLRAGGYSITMLNDETGKADAALAPTKKNIDAALDKVLRGAKAGDTVIVALCGHGIQFAQDKDAYFCPSDARPFADETASMVSVSGLYRQFEKSFAGVRVLLMDACRNDPSSNRSGIGAESVPLPSGVAALFSCSAGQRAYEHESLNHGVFFYYVLQGLRGEAANKDGVVTWGGLADYVGGAVPAKVLTLFPGQKLEQSPNAKADIIGMPPVLLTVRVPGRDDVHAAPPVAKPPAPDGQRAVPPAAGAIGPFTNTLGMTLVPVPAGEFDMGSPETEPGRDKSETLHHVKISSGFYMATTPVTQERWWAVMGTSLAQQRLKAGYNALHGEGIAFPMYFVSWDDAVSFCQKLSEKEKKHYRLPTEAEWEYACRGGDPRQKGTKTAFSFGDGEKLLGDYAWYVGNSGAATHKVGTKKPNPLGLYDMQGNVWQWCSDAYGDYPAPDAVKPTGPEIPTTGNSLRVLRGGAWNCTPRLCRAAGRFKLAAGLRSLSVGFRVCLDE